MLIEAVSEVGDVQTPLEPPAAASQPPDINDARYTDIAAAALLKIRSKLTE